MSEKKRFLVGYSHSVIVPQDRVAQVESFMATQSDVQCVRKLKTDHRILDMTEEQAAALAENDPDLIIEEDEPLDLFLPMPGLPPTLSSDQDLFLTVKVVNEQTEKPIKDVTIFALGAHVTYRGLTDNKGLATIRVLEQELPQVIASPKSQYWSSVQRHVKVSRESNHKLLFKLKELPVRGDYTWGHLALGIDKVSHRFTGKGVKVAVIDSGISEHEDLRVQGGYNTLDGQKPAAWNIDEKGHGTHCTGILAAQQNEVGIRGVAPDADIYSLKVFPGGRLSDLIEAVNWCIDHDIDVINMSLGSRNPSVQVEVALNEAYSRGITLVAAAGNNGGPVAYPAAYGSVIAVSALGKTDSFPPDSGHALKVGPYQSADGQYFMANFSNFGRAIDVCAPGVAILSSVPTNYAAWDGTSMACPFIAGLVALTLEAYPDLRTGDSWQPYSIYEALTQSALDVGLPQTRQGFGLPNAETLLGAALAEHEAREQATAMYQEEMEDILEQARTYMKALEDSVEHLKALETS